MHTPPTYSEKLAILNLHKAQHPIHTPPPQHPSTSQSPHIAFELELRFGSGGLGVRRHGRNPPNTSILRSTEYFILRSIL